jgi:hypothetical protein
MIVESADLAADGGYADDGDDVSDENARRARHQPARSLLYDRREAVEKSRARYSSRTGGVGAHHHYLDSTFETSATEKEKAVEEKKEEDKEEKTEAEKDKEEHPTGTEGDAAKEKEEEADKEKEEEAAKEEEETEDAQAAEESKR